MIADLLGLAAAFVLLQGVLESSGDRVGMVPLDGELLLFACSLPIWVVLARAMGLYDRDEERPEHTTIDDLVGVFQLVTIGIWLNFVVASVTGLADPDLGKWIRVLGDRDRVRRDRALRRTVSRAPQPAVRAERARRRDRPNGADHRPEAAQAPGVPHQRRRLRRRVAEGAPGGRLAACRSSVPRRT